MYWACSESVLLVAGLDEDPIKVAEKRPLLGRQCRGNSTKDCYYNNLKAEGTGGFNVSPVSCVQLAACFSRLYLRFLLARASLSSCGVAVSLRQPMEESKSSTAVSLSGLGFLRGI